MAIGFSPTGFLAKLEHGGALQSLFEVTITTPSGLGGEGADSSAAIADYPYMTKAATFPESTITATPISYMGREIQIPGNRESTQWTNTVYNDEDFLVRHMLEDWTWALNSASGNARVPTWTQPSKYTGTLQVTGFNKALKTTVATDTAPKVVAPEVSTAYKFWYVWPSSVGEVTLDWETNEIQEYEVTWEYAYWTRIP
jgi:hypothetical protein